MLVSKPVRTDSSMAFTKTLGLISRLFESQNVFQVLDGRMIRLKHLYPSIYSMCYGQTENSKCFSDHILTKMVLFFFFITLESIYFFVLMNLFLISYLILYKKGWQLVDSLWFSQIRLLDTAASPASFFWQTSSLNEVIGMERQSVLTLDFYLFCGEGRNEGEMCLPCPCQICVSGTAVVPLFLKCSRMMLNKLI